MPFTWLGAIALGASTFMLNTAQAGGVSANRIARLVDSKSLFPVQTLVHPKARLDLKYFLEKQVFSAAPFTRDIEPAVPFAIGLLVSNSACS